MTELTCLSDRELRTKLQQYGLADVPITKTTRDLVIKRLKSAIESSSNGHSQEHVEPASDTRQATTRRRSMAAPAKPKAKTKQSVSLAGTLSPSKSDQSDESDGHVKDTRSIRLSTLNSSRNGNRNGKDDLNSMSGNMTDDELIRQLATYLIPAPAITSSTRPILIKKLNHAIAKQRRESKTFTHPIQNPHNLEPEESNHETDTDNENPSFTSANEKPCLSIPFIETSQQHSSFPMNHSPLFPTDSSFIAKYFEHKKPFSSSISSFNSPSSIVNKSIVVNRFVEEQEPYDTCSDSDTDAPSAKVSPKKKWSFWSYISKLPQSSLAKTSSVRSSLLTKLKNKLSILWHWQIITVVLPLSALLFFLFLAAFYIRASYNESMTNISQPPSEFDQTIQLVKEFIEKDFVYKHCMNEDLHPISRAVLIRELHLNDSVIDQVQNVVESNSQWGITVEEDFWSPKSTKVPFSCWIRSFLRSVFFALMVIMAVSIGGAILYHLITLNRRQCEREEQEVYALVEKIIDLLARHQSAMVAEKRPQEAFLAVAHVRDVLIPLKERKMKTKLWDKAVQFLEENESRVRPEIQQIEGEDYNVWRWLPPSCAFGSPKNTILGDQTDEGAANHGESVNISPRPKVWQGQAFSTDSTGVNSPPPYPLTQCLKVRNMFDSEVEVGDSWPVRIQDAILEKADQGKILHMAVDRGSREGCVYIKCSSAEEAGKVYRALHGWWFDGNLVTVKYLRPERYHYRFPDSAKAKIPLQPSNDKRLSLPTKFWKSPLEHI